MAKILVAYFSKTGNTEKIANAIFESLKGEKVIAQIDDVSDLDSFDLIFVGFPVHSHSVPLRVQNFLKKIPPGKKIALFSTHGSHTGSRLSREALEHAVVVASKAKVLGTFSCRGKVSLEALEVLHKSPEHKAWTEMAASSRSHPDEGDFEDARSFAQWINLLSSNESD